MQTKGERRLYRQKWYQENKERINAKLRAWDLANPEKTKEKRRRYYDKNRVAHIAKTRKWQADNPERRSEYARKYYAANSEKIKAYQKDYQRKYYAARKARGEQYADGAVHTCAGEPSRIVRQP